MISYDRYLENKHTMLMQKSILQPKKKKLVIQMWSWIYETLNQRAEP